MYDEWYYSDLEAEYEAFLELAQSTNDFQEDYPKWQNI